MKEIIGKTHQHSKSKRQWSLIVDEKCIIMYLECLIEGGWNKRGGRVVVGSFGKFYKT